jgi:hypothetical protein
VGWGVIGVWLSICASQVLPSGVLCKWVLSSLGVELGRGISNTDQRMKNDEVASPGHWAFVDRYWIFWLEPEA